MQSVKRETRKPLLLCNYTVPTFLSFPSFQSSIGIPSRSTLVTPNTTPLDHFHRPASLSPLRQSCTRRTLSGVSKPTSLPETLRPSLLRITTSHVVEFHRQLHRENSGGPDRYDLFRLILRSLCSHWRYHSLCLREEKTGTSVLALDRTEQGKGRAEAWELWGSA